jgi:hypothetical protein
MFMVVKMTHACSVMPQLNRSLRANAAHFIAASAKIDEMLAFLREKLI